MYEWRIFLPVIFVARTRRDSSRVEKVISQVCSFSSSSLSMHLQSAVKWWTWEERRVLQVGNGEARLEWKCERTFSQSINQITTVSWWSCCIFTNNSVHDLSNNLVRLVSCYMSGSTYILTLRLTKPVVKGEMNIQMSPRPRHYSSINMSCRREGEGGGGRWAGRRRRQYKEETVMVNLKNICHSYILAAYEKWLVSRGIYPSSIDVHCAGPLKEMK